MQAELIKTFRFDAAHSLKNLPAGHKCSRLHGHSYRVDIHVSGPADARTGMVVDFAQIKAVVAPILGELDHRCLDEVEGLENSTSELLCQYLWGRIQPLLAGLSAITIWESDDSRCVYRGL